MADPTPAPITAADTVTPWYLDKAFLLVPIHLLAMVVMAVFHVTLNDSAVAADLAAVIAYILAHKAKSGAALWALIKQQAAQRYTVPDPATATLPQVAAALDKPPAVP